MKPACYRILNFVLLSFLLPLLSGCGGGGGGGGVSGAISSLLGSSGDGGSGNSGASALLSLDGGTTATIHNPEPATMLLMGGGLAAMAFYKRRFKKP